MKYTQATGVVKREIAGEIFLVHVKQKLVDMQNLFVLHGSAEFIWDSIDGVAGRDTLISMVLDEFDVSEQVASDDVDSFLALLSAEGLIVTVG
jgi:hypothetical protein